MEYYGESVLFVLGETLDQPIKVDIQTMDVSCGRFARIYVEIDLNLSIVGQLWIHDR